MAAAAPTSASARPSTFRRSLLQRTGRSTRGPTTFAPRWMPIWKQPFWYWIKWFNAWPFSVEAFSGIFDFNRAPFFQSFMEVRVERSKNRVVLILNSVHGPLQWSDLQTSSPVIPLGVKPDDPVEFVVSMDRQ